jgi:hypothetical protein
MNVPRASDCPDDDNVTLHAVIFCWPGKETNARCIASVLHDHVEHLAVIYKNDNGRTEDGWGEWHKVPNQWYFGRQCKRSFELFRGDVLLQIQADVYYRDWPRLVRRCREAFRSSARVGVWAPDVFYCAHPPELTRLAPGGWEQMINVSRTDGIVWALARPVVTLLDQLNYEVNNLGWGIDDAAAAYARFLDLRVLIDTSLSPEHPKGSGYSHGDALRQRQAFISQLPKQEIEYIRWMEEDERIRRTFRYRWRRNFRLVALCTRRFLRHFADHAPSRGWFFRRR